MADSKPQVALNIAPTIDQINADRITQVFIVIIHINYIFNNCLKQYIIHLVSIKILGTKCSTRSIFTL